MDVFGPGSNRAISYRAGSENVQFKGDQGPGTSDLSLPIWLSCRTAPGGELLSRRKQLRSEPTFDSMQTQIGGQYATQELDIP